MITTVENHGDWSAAGDETCTRTWYARNTAKGLTSLVSRTRTVGKPCADSDDRLTLPTNTATRGDVLSDAATVFDNPAATAWTATQTPTLGLPTWTGQPTGYPAANGTADRNPGAGSWQTVVTTQFDTDTAGLGRPLKSTDGKGNATTTAYYPAAGGPVTGVIVTHPKLASNGQAHKSYTYFDPARGSVNYTLDANLKRTEYTRDALGRTTAVWLPNRSKAAGDSPSGSFGYKLSQTAPSWTSVAQLKADGIGYRTSYTLYDSLLRKIQTQTPGVNGGRILTDTRYDARGLAVVTQADAFDNATAPNSTYTGIENAQAPVQNDMVHDGAGRVAKTTLSSWGTKKWDTRTTYTGDSVATTAVQGGTASRVITDALGRTAETRTYAGPEPDDTQYGAATAAPYTRVAHTYARDGKPLTVTGPDGSVWSHSYDLYGREVSSTDPDTGTITTGYTALDQVDHTKDAEGHLILFGYDELGRKTDMWHTSRTDANKLAKWTFDGLLKGLPDKSVRYENGVNQTGSKEYTKTVTAYDTLGRATSTTLTLPASDPWSPPAPSPRPSPWAPPTGSTGRSTTSRSRRPAGCPPRRSRPSTTTRACPPDSPDSPVTCWAPTTRPPARSTRWSWASRPPPSGSSSPAPTSPAPAGCSPPPPTTRRAVPYRTSRTATIRRGTSPPSTTAPTRAPVATTSASATTGCAG